MFKKLLPIILIATLILALAGCNTDKDSGGNDAGSDEDRINELMAQPVTLKVFAEVAITDDDWDNIVVQPLKEKYPNVTLELTKRTKNDEIVELVAGGYIPDMLVTGFFFLGKLLDLGLPLEIDDLMKKSQVDAAAFNPTVIESLKGFRDGKLIALPIYMNTATMLYNKDIFDTFGVEYPTDGMSWDEAYQLSLRLNRTADEVKYYGLNALNWDNLGSQLSLPKIDPATNKTLVHSDGYRRVLELIRDIFVSQEKHPNQQPNFFRDRNVAMFTFWFSDAIAQFETLNAAGNPMNWDMVTQPYFPERPGVGTKVDAHLVMATAQSPYQEQVFEVMKFLSTSEEVQTKFAQRGKMPALERADVRSEFGVAYETLQGKNIDAVFKVQMAPLPPFHPLENIALAQPMDAAWKKIILQNMDVNTALREAEEAINQRIETLLKD